MVEHGETEIKMEGAEAAFILEAYLTVTPTDDPTQAFAELVDVIADWSVERGESGGGVALALIAPRSLQEQLLAYTIAFVQEDESFRDFFQRIGDVSVYVGESVDYELQEIQIAAVPSEDQQNA